MNRKELFMKKRKIATILLAACLLLGNVSVANAASIDNGNKVHFNTEDNDTDLTASLPQKLSNVKRRVSPSNGMYTG